MRPDYFGESVAAGYDEDGTGVFAPSVIGPAVDFLAALAAAGPVGPDREPTALELGIGTGRIALPLSERGVRVHGIDLSEAMVARLRAKPGAERVTVTIGDFATARAGGEFGLAYLVFNTIGNLTTQDDQVECFRSAAAHLRPGGHFVIEVGVRLAENRLVTHLQEVRRRSANSGAPPAPRRPLGPPPVHSAHLRRPLGLITARSRFAYRLPAPTRRDNSKWRQVDY